MIASHRCITYVSRVYVPRCLCKEKMREFKGEKDWLSSSSLQKSEGAEKGKRDWNSGMAPASELSLLCVVFLPVWGRSPTCYVTAVLPGPLHGVGVDLFSNTYLHFKSLGLDFLKNWWAPKRFMVLQQQKFKHFRHFLGVSCWIYKQSVRPKILRCLK